MDLYVVVLRTPSGAVFQKGHSLLIHYGGSSGPRNVKFQTLYGDRGLGSETIIDLCIAVTGSAKDLQSAIHEFANTAQGATSIVSLGSNTPIEQPPIVELAYDVTPEFNEHDYFQRKMPELPVQILPGRRTDPASLTKLFEALGSHPKVNRLMRAAAHYNLALSYWQPGKELIALNHLWIAAETLTPVAQHRELKKHCVEEDGLYEKWQIDPQDKKANWKTKLAAEVRRRILFQGDDECYRLAKKASDGFEHGYMAFPVLHAHAGKSRDRTATYVRKAIFDLAGIEGTLLEALLRPPFDKPLERWRPDMQIWGKLTGSIEDLAPAGEEHPSMEWRTGTVTAKPIDDGKMSFHFQEKFKKRIGERATFTRKRFEVWGPRPDPDREGS